MAIDPEQEKIDGHESSRRLARLRQIEGLDLSPTPLAQGMDITVFTLPPSDPTGLAEYLEARYQTEILAGLRLEQEYPHVESFYNPFLPGTAPEACKETDDLIAQQIESGIAWIQGHFQQGVDYATFADPTGGLFSFYFRSAEQLKAFRNALGLSPEKGFDAIVEQLKSAISESAI